MKTKDSGDTNLDEKVVNKTKLATTPRTRSVRKTKKAGQGRFDVDGILTEIDKVPTPSDKELLAYQKATTPTATTNSSNLTPGRSKDVACTLFDTPTNTSASPTNKRESRKNEPDEAFADVEEVEKEPAVKATKPEYDAVKELPSVIDISSDSNVETATETQVPVKKSTMKKRKGAGSVEPDTSKLSTSSSKKQKAETAVISSSKMKRVFLLSGDRDQATAHTSIITSLGASVSKFGRVFDSNCTHIIFSELKRTEKLIAGCAAGKVSV